MGVDWLYWFRTETNVGILWTQARTLGFHSGSAIFWLYERLPTFQGVYFIVSLVITEFLEGPRERTRNLSKARPEEAACSCVELTVLNTLITDCGCSSCVELTRSVAGFARVTRKNRRVTSLWFRTCPARDSRARPWPQLRRHLPPSQWKGLALHSDECLITRFWKNKPRSSILEGRKRYNCPV